MIRLSAASLSFSVFAGAAALVLGGGVWLAARDQEKRIVPDRLALRDFAKSLQAELTRLETLYESDLRELAGRVSTRNPDSTRSALAEFAGVRGVAEFRPGLRRAGTILHTDPLDAKPLPEIELVSADSPAPAMGAFTLSRSLVFSADPDAARDGWTGYPADPMGLFWNWRNEGLALVLYIDRAEVDASANAYLRHWIDARFEGIKAARGIDRVESARGLMLAGVTDIPNRPPDFVIPMPTRLGEWQIVSWDHFEQHREYHPLILTAAMGGAAVLVAAGVVTARQQSRAQRLADQRVSFANRVSHELGAPLTNMLLNLDLAQDAVERAPAETSRRLNLIREEAQRLGRLVENVLTFSRRERRLLKLTPVICRPVEVLDQVLAQFGPALARRRIAVKRRDAFAGQLLLDPDALSQVAANLVSNAEKYAPPGGYLEIESGVIEQQFVVRVLDDGPGVPPEARTRIFEPFERASERTTEGVSGSGLGLAIARDLSVLMGGTLRLLPSAQGAHFEMRVPAIFPS